MESDRDRWQRAAEEVQENFRASQAENEKVKFVVLFFILLV